MTTQTLNLSFRPRSFDEMIGQKHMIDLIRKQIKSGRVPAAWMFVGESGSGKTTTARILALSLQCTHQTEFGNPCDACQKGRSKFDILEINASENSGVSEVESTIVGAFYTPKPPSKYRVYIFDEAQMLSSQAQNALLKYFEDSPKSTVWIICTTEPQKIKRTLRRRCLNYTIPSLGIKGVGALVKSALTHTKSDLPDEPLIEALLEAGISSPGFVVMAVEKYLAGETAEKSAQVGFDSAIDTLRVCRAVVKGDWDTVRAIMASANPEDARAIRQSLGGYLKAILLDSEPGKQASKVEQAIGELMKLTMVEDGLQLSATTAVVYRVCRMFS